MTHGEKSKILRRVETCFLVRITMNKVKLSQAKINKLDFTRATLPKLQQEPKQSYINHSDIHFPISISAGVPRPKASSDPFENYTFASTEICPPETSTEASGA
jgi:hypothetical protein